MAVLEVSIEIHYKEVQKGVYTDSVVVSVQKEGTREESQTKEPFSLCEVATFCSDHNHVLSGFQSHSSPFYPSNLIPNNTASSFILSEPLR